MSQPQQPKAAPTPDELVAMQAVPLPEGASYTPPQHISEVTAPTNNQTTDQTKWMDTYDIQLPDGSWTTLSQLLANEVRKAETRARKDELNRADHKYIKLNLSKELHKFTDYIDQRFKELDGEKDR